MVLDGFFDAIFGWAIRISPLVGILVVAATLTLITTLVYKFATDQKRMKAIRDELKSIQEEMKKMKDDPKRIMELQKDMWQKNLESMKHNFKPMLITFLPIIIVFQWMGKTFSPFGDIVWTLGWLGTYIILTLILSIAFRKLFKVY